jgi:hypothetical protein
LAYLVKREEGGGRREEGGGRMEEREKRRGDNPSPYTTNAFHAEY